MIPDDFKAWRKKLELSQQEAADALGLSLGTVSNYERGTRREDGRPVEIPLVVALACAAVDAGLPPWGDLEITSLGSEIASALFKDANKKPAG